MIKNLLLNLLFLTLALASCEFMLRLINIRSAMVNNDSVASVYQFDPVLGWAGRPNLKLSGDFEGQRFEYEFNSLGFRTQEFRNIRNDKFRVVLVGDSFGFGYLVPLDKAFAGILQNEYAERAEFLSLAQIGYSTDQQYILLHQVMPALEMDLVVVSLFLNDLYDNGQSSLDYGFYQKPYFEILRNENLKYHGEHLRNSSGWPSLLYLTMSVHGLVSNRIQDWSVCQGQGWKCVFQKNFRESQAWKTSRSILHNFQTMLNERNVKLLLVVIPAKEQLQGVVASVPQELLSDMCKELSIECLDLLPSLRNQGGADNYFVSDPHFNTKGHRVAAQSIKDRIEKLLPSR